MVKLGWLSDVEPIEVQSVDEAMQIIRAVDEEYLQKDAITLQLTREDGGTMTVVLGAARWCLIWFPSDYDGIGSYHTVADGFDPTVDKIAPDPEVLTFYTYGHHSEVPLEYTVPKQQALQAIREFMSSPKRPLAVQWDLD